MPVSRREFIAVSSSTLAAMPLAAWAGQTQAPPTTHFEAVRRNVGYFTARGGTIGWLSNKDSLLVVDSQYPDTAALFLGTLEQKTTRGIDVLFNTHHHADHTGGNGILKPKTKRIVAQTKVPDLQKRAAAQQAQTQPNAAQTPQVVADATFDKTWGVDAGDERVTARHYGPGHTGGDAIIQFEHAHIVHMGDLFWNEIHPFVDRPFGASIQNWMKTIETVSKAMPADTTYIAGHARAGQPVVVDRAALLRQRDYFDAVLTYARKGIADGKSRDEIAKLENLSGFESYQSLPPRATLAFVLGVAYDEVTNKSVESR
jgi:cyclase